MLENRLRELFVFLKSRNYPDEIISYGIQQAKGKGPIVSRQGYIRGKTKNDVIPFVSTYNAINFNMFPIIRNYENLMKTDKDMEKVITKKNIINSKRQPKNIKR